MIELVIALLIAMSGRGDVCSIGEAVHWYDWTEAHPEAYVLGKAWVRNEFEVALYQAYKGSDEIIVFVFDMENFPHGQCARRIYRSQLKTVLVAFETYP